MKKQMYRNDLFLFYAPNSIISPFEQFDLRDNAVANDTSWTTLDEKSNLQIPSNLLQRFGTAAVCIALLIFISGLYDFTLHLQIRKYDGLTYCGRIAKIITTAF